MPAHLIRTAVFIVDQPQNWNVANTDVSYCTRRIKTGGTLVISLVGIDTISYPAAAANGDLGKAVDAALGLNVGTYLLACWDDILESLSSYASPFKIGHP